MKSVLQIALSFDILTTPRLFLSGSSRTSCSSQLNIRSGNSDQRSGYVFKRRLVRNLLCGPHLGSLITTVEARHERHPYSVSLNNDVFNVLYYNRCHFTTNRYKHLSICTSIRMKKITRYIVDFIRVMIPHEICKSKDHHSLCQNIRQLAELTSLSNND